MKTAVAKDIRVQHAIPGRIRLKTGLNGDATLLSRSLEKMEGVRWVRTNQACASIVVRYDPERLRTGELMADIQRRFTPRPVGTRKPTALNAKTPPKSGLRAALRRFIGISLMVAGVFVRQVILKRPLAQNLLSPLGLMAAVAAWPLVKAGARDIRKGQVTLESFLGGSIVAAVAAGEAMAAMEILWITSAGTLLQTWITERSRRAISEILQITEKETYILVEGAEMSIPVEEVVAGDTVVLHTGEKIAVDGEIVQGEALVDESPITGYCEPVLRRYRDKVYAGTFVRQGVIYVRAEGVGDRTYLARVLRMVEESLENKAPIEGVADRLAKNLIRAGFVTTFTTLLITGSPWRAFTVMLVMACPCATILSASTAISAAINTAARQHILIKGGRYLEEAGTANIICFDKTGTLTTNLPEIRELVNLNGLAEDELLQLACSAELHNRHPLALALKNEAQKRGIKPISHEVCEYFLGKGVRSEIQGDEILVGSHKLMADFLITTDELREQIDLQKLELAGLTLIFIARNREILGAIGFANQERPELAALLDYFRKDGAEKIVMITGDAKNTALDMACRLNFDQCRYSVLPEQKADIVGELRADGDRVLMVGDGINDALALAEADIGVAMGAGGSEVAIEAADIALVTDDLHGVIYLRGLSKKTLRVVHQNFWIATGSNVAGVVLGALGMLSPVMAGMVHITHTLGILANSARLLTYDPEKGKPSAKA